MSRRKFWEKVFFCVCVEESDCLVNFVEKKMHLKKKYLKNDRWETNNILSESVLLLLFTSTM